MGCRGLGFRVQGQSIKPQNMRSRGFLCFGAILHHRSGVMISGSKADLVIPRRVSKEGSPWNFNLRNSRNPILKRSTDVTMFAFRAWVKHPTNPKTPSAEPPPSQLSRIVSHIQPLQRQRPQNLSPNPPKTPEP